VFYAPNDAAPIDDNDIDVFKSMADETPQSSIAYFQFDPLGTLIGNEALMNLSHDAHASFDFTAKAKLIAAAYYGENFPDLHAMSCDLHQDLSAEQDRFTGETVLNVAPLNPSHNGLIVPTFAPLNRIGLFVIDISKHEILRGGTVVLQRNLIARILTHAQNLHLQICRKQNRAVSDRSKLTARERDILLWVVRGKSNSEIAKTLNLSLHTVTGYLRNIYIKTECTDRTSAAIYAVHRGILQDKSTETALAHNGNTAQMNSRTG
jgi:DNA-binding CsgD family transcriptional regulator